MTFSGDIVPKKKVEVDLTKEKNRQVRARAIAKAFLDDETDLFGIVNPSEILETTISTEKGFGGDYTYIRYQRYIAGIKLQGAGIQITIGPEETIKLISADLAAVPSEAYEAIKKKTLSKEEIESIMETKLTEEDKSNKDIDKIFKTFVKLALIVPPYVIWEATDTYFYRIDAFTGAILMKEPFIIPSIPYKQK
jgi:Zn-dependent metalloprotease